MTHITRRAALQALGTASLAGLVVQANAQASAEPAPRLLLVDASLSPGELRAPLRRVAVGAARKVEADLVVQWRKSLRHEIERHPGPVVALLRWDKALVLSGLAREQRWRAPSRRISASVFQIELQRV